MTGDQATHVAHARGLVTATSKQDWRQSFIVRLCDKPLLEDITEARRLAHKAKSFVLVDMALYKKSASGIKHKCILIEEGRHLLVDIHAKICRQYVTPDPWLGRPSDKVSTGRPPLQAPSKLFELVRAANIMHDRRTCRHMPCKLSPSPGPSWSRGWT